MASETIRDPAKDHLLTPKNSAMLIIDYQPAQVNLIASMDRQKLIDNIVGVAKAGRAFGLPIVHSTVNVKTGLNKPAIPHLRKVLGDLPAIDRTSINAWEDVEFVQAVKATARDRMWGPTFPELVEAHLAFRSSTDRQSMPGMIPKWPQRSEAMGRKKLITAGISLEVGAAFPAITAIGKGYDAYVAVDASGTFSDTNATPDCCEFNRRA